MPNHATPSPTDRWVTLLAPLTAFVAPVATARRADRAPLWWAWIVHLIGLAMVVVVSAGLDAWQQFYSSTSLADLGSRTWSILIDRIAWAAMRDRTEFLVGLTMIECFSLMLALSLIPWGAGDESGNRAMARTFRRAFLFTPHLALLVLIVFGIEIGLSRFHNEYWEGYHAIGKTWDELAAARPWLLGWYYEITTAVYLAAITWGVLALLRAAAVRPEGPRCVWPPTCEACGYTLTGVLNQPTCPECGFETRRSLDPAARPGAPWERRKEIGRAAAWLHTALIGVLHPHRLASQLRLWSGVREARRFLLLNIGVIVLLSAWCLFCITAMDQWEYEPDWWDHARISIVVGYVVGIASLVLALFNAFILGLGTRRADKRAMLAGGMQAASYASGFLILWCLLLWAQVGFFTLMDPALESLFREPARRLGIDSGILIFILVVAPHAVCLIVYTLLVGQITRKLVHVNR